MKANEIKVLRKLINKNAISFMIKNEKEFETQYDSFINSNRIIGIDLGSGKDVTVYTPHKIN